MLLSTEDALTLDVRGRTEAAVLVPLYLDRGRLHTVFTKRQADLRRHPGEISFPGGRYDEGERDLSATALREAHEEIGLPADAVEIVGALQPTPTIATGYAVYPFVGLIEPGRTWTPSVDEVAEVLELSLADAASRIRAPAADPPGRPDPDRHVRRRRPSDLGSDGPDPRRPVRQDRAAAQSPRAGAQPFSIGTLTRFPHSVQEPSGVPDVGHPEEYFRTNQVWLERSPILGLGDHGVPDGTTPLPT